MNPEDVSVLLGEVGEEVVSGPAGQVPPVIHSARAVPATQYICTVRIILIYQIQLIGTKDATRVKQVKTPFGKS